MRQVLTGILIVVFIITLITVAFTFNQVQQEGQRLESDLQRRSSLVADSLKETVEPNFINKSDKYLQSLVERFADNQRVAGLAIVDNKGEIVAASPNLPTDMPEFQKIGTDVMDLDLADGKFLNFGTDKMYVFASPLHENKSVVGSLLIAQHADYIDTRLGEIWKNNLLRLAAQAFLISVAVFLILKWIIFEPIKNLVSSLQLTRSGSLKKGPNRVLNNPIFGPLLQEVGNMQQSLINARIAASEEARLRLKKLTRHGLPSGSGLSSSAC